MTARFITVTYEVTLEVDEDTSLNHAEDAVSLQLWHIGDDRDDLVAVGARLIESVEHQQDILCGECGVLIADPLHPNYDSFDPSNALCPDHSGLEVGR